MLTGFTWCIPLKTKTAEEVAKAYLDRQWDRVQKQTLQGSCCQTGHGILHTFTTIQTTKQWED